MVVRSSATNAYTPMSVDVKGLVSRVPRGAWFGAGVAVVAVVAITALPGAYHAVSDGFARLGSADGRWIALALGLEALSFLGHIILFRTVFLDKSSRVDFAASYEITMAGHAATRVFGAAGAGGIAVTVWALRRAGLAARTIAARMAGFLVLLYSFYAIAVALVGIGLATGVLAGGGSTALTLVPGLIAVGVVAAVLTLAATSGRLVARAPERIARRLEPAADTVMGGVREALVVLKRRDPGLLGGTMWWAFDIAVLWACFHAFGAAPAIAVVVLGYFLGLVGNALPFFGSVGGVDGGMIGALIALGADPGTTVVAVVVYRLISCWLPAIPGAFAYVQLRKRTAEWQQGEELATVTPLEVPVARSPAAVPAQPIAA
ncbi:MAG: YbhN family protein [Thermoleophilaceae bacterium]